MQSSKFKKKKQGLATDFYDEEKRIFNVDRENKVSNYLGEEIENPKYNFTQVEQIIQNRIKDLQTHLYNLIKNFVEEKKIYDELASDADNDADVLRSDVAFKIKGNFETMFNDMNEQLSLNLLYQKQITSLKKEKNETLLVIKKISERCDELEKALGVNIKDKRERLDKKREETMKLPQINFK